MMLDVRRLALALLATLCTLVLVDAYRVLVPGEITPQAAYFRPYDQGFVGRYGDPSNLQRERVNEGAFQTASQELLYEGVSPRQACPGMVGPFSDGNFYCTGREFGYCDRRSGACFCNTGYVGMDCSECHGSHFKSGTLCVPKSLCREDCSGAGDCNFYDGTCDCQEHRAGDYCQIKLCTTFSPLCETCTAQQCLRCMGGYYLTGDAAVCGSCYDFDPRCAGCTKDGGCSVCADPLLTSVRRSGYRPGTDPRLPLEEDTRELSITIPFGSKSVDSFAEAEHYLVTEGYSMTNKLGTNAQKCIQGLSDDDSWVCSGIAASHVVCGHFGVFKFGYPNYVVRENVPNVRLSVSRSGGGYGNVTVNYYIAHFTTNDSDVTATAIYTTSQKLVFDEGVVERSFLINIQDDNLVEANEVFQVVLEVPEGGGSVGPQFRTNVTIIDDDAAIFSSVLSYPIWNNTRVRAMQPYSLIFQASDAKGKKVNLGGERILSVVENDLKKWADPGSNHGTQRHALRQMVNVIDIGDGTYKIEDPVGLREQGQYQLRAWHAFPGGLKGQYYYDGFFQKIALERQDRVVNFTWGMGKIAPHSIDYVTVRWTGALLADSTADYWFRVDADDNARLWVNGVLLLDHWHEMWALLEPSRKIRLQGGKLYELVLEYRDIRGEAHCVLLWGKTPLANAVVPQANLFGLYELRGLSPVDLHIKSSQTQPTKSECQGEGLYGGVALAKSHFTVCPRDDYYNLRDDDDEWYLASELFSSTLTHTNDLGHNGEGSEIITPTLTYDHGIHCFRGEYVPQKAGEYRLDIEFQSDNAAAKIHVAGSPFTVTVKPAVTFGPYSVITNIATPVLSLVAGTCHTFTITSRDASRNLILKGGDSYSVYSYQVAYSSNTANIQPNSVHNATKPNVRYGTVQDKSDGTYLVEICPVLQGTHEVHILLRGTGVSNQPFRILDKAASFQTPSGFGTHEGQYVHDSPYRLEVKHASAHGYTTTAEGNGLVNAIVGVPREIMITVRDPWDNVLITTASPATVCTILLDRSPTAVTSVVNLLNGSYTFQYTAKVSGDNLISIMVNSMHIKGSPFVVPIESGRPDRAYSIAFGAGLSVGTVNVPSYFQVYAYDLSNNRRTSSGDVYDFEVSGANTLTGTLLPCPKPPVQDHPICDGYDLALGHYWGTFTPVNKGATSVAVFLADSSHKIVSDPIIRAEVLNSPFAVTVVPGAPVPANTDIDGDIYDTIAGIKHTMLLKLRDLNRNLLISGGHYMEYVMYAVASEWGTVQPWGTTPGLPDAYHYKGFYSGDQDFYGDWIDNGDGTYTLSHNATVAGQYVSRYSLGISGLNATYFNNTKFGYLYDQDFNPLLDSRYKDKNDKQPRNLGTTISWTGDIGGRPNEGNPATLEGKGSLGDGSYYDMFKSRVEPNLQFNYTHGRASRAIGYLEETNSAFRREDKFREEFWSARWVGMIVPKFAETYKFSVNLDADSDAQIYIGGRGVATNGSFSEPPKRVLTIGRSLADKKAVELITGTFNFTDTKPRDIIIEYIHYEGASSMNLMWESISTPREIVPPSAFFHWSNISHFNTTVHPAVLSPKHSTAWGNALTNGTVGHLHSFTVYARDEFRNLRQSGGDVPSMLAVGSDGAMFRGNVTDYGNSTYLIEYYATVAGEFHMYVTMGCCPAHPNVGVASEIRMFQNLLIEGAPFHLVIQPDQISALHSVAIGDAVTGSIAGEVGIFNVMLRDLHNNPTTVDALNVQRQVMITVDFVEIATGNIINSNIVQEKTVAMIDVAALQAGDSRVLVRYNLTQAGEYLMNVRYNSDTSPGATALPTHILGSPYRIRVLPAKATAFNAISRGLGLRQGSRVTPFSFEVQLLDTYGNLQVHGGYKLFVRLYGDAKFRESQHVIPKCTDMLDGRYRCTYTALYDGSHELQVLLLNSSTTSPGGLGLTANYFASPTAGGLDDLAGVDAAISDAVQSVYERPYVTRIDSTVSGSWPDGYIIPVLDASTAGHKGLLSMRSYNNTDQVEGTVESQYGHTTGGSDGRVGVMRALGQSVTWEGYVVPPRDDDFTFRLLMERMKGSIYIDEQLVFDSAEGISEMRAFMANAAYHIRVEVVVTEATKWNAPVSVDLQWSTPIIKWAKIPAFFLFDSAEEVDMSPFPVNIGGMKTNVHYPGMNTYP